MEQDKGSEGPRTLGRYELLGTLGTGGMATVYLARTAGEAGFQRLFAIKVLHRHLENETGFLTMFLDEARIAARLHHPNVVPIVDLATESGLHYVAMEYIEGCSLSALLKKHPQDRPPRVLVPIVIDALAGLDAAHSLTDDAGNPINLVHRDVSPQNILVGVDGAARITDFGVARAESRLGGTRPGQLKGKIAYMSPEQIRGQPITRRSDIFSAGAMLWSMLTGRRLFHGENDAATMYNIVNLEVPAASTIGLKPPTVFDPVIARALERDPEKRYATAAEMEEGLREAMAAAGLTSSRRDITAFVTDTFKDILAARRNAIRSATPRVSSVADAAFRPSAEIPSFTPASMSSNASMTYDFEEPEISISATQAAPGTTPRRRRWPLVAGALVAAAAIAAGIWYTQRPTETTPSADETAKRYLDEAERLAGENRQSAHDLVAKARELHPSDPDLNIRIARLDDRTRVAAAEPAVGAPAPATNAATTIAEPPPQTPPPEPAVAVKQPATPKRTVVRQPPPPPPKRTSAVKTVAAAPVEATTAPPAPQIAPPPPPAAPPATTPASKPVAPPAPPPATPAATTPAPKPATPAPASTEIATPRLPAAYSARSMKEVQKVLSVIEGEAVDRGNVPASMHGVTSGIAEEAFANFAPGQLVELHPRDIYFAIVRGVRAGKTASAIRASLRSAYQQGQL